MTDPPPVLELRGLTMSLGATPLFEGLDLQLSAGDICLAVGPSGEGKTTLLRLISGLVAPDAGSVLVHGSTWQDRNHAATRLARRQIGLVQQRPGFRRGTALDEVMLPLLFAGQSADESRSAATAALEQVGLAQMAQRPTDHLSGGERQRLALARALVCTPSLLLLDEFTNHQDPIREETLEALVLGAAEAGAALVVVTHDASQARRLAQARRGGGEAYGLLLLGGAAMAGPWEELITRANDGEGADAQYLQRLGGRAPA